MTNLILGCSFYAIATRLLLKNFLKKIEQKKKAVALIIKYIELVTSTSFRYLLNFCH